MRKFKTKTARQCKVEKRNVGYNTPCVICNNKYNAGLAPSLFVYFEETDFRYAYEPTYNQESHCDWVCSKKCATLWMFQRM